MTRCTHGWHRWEPPTQPRRTTWAWCEVTGLLKTDKDRRTQTDGQTVIHFCSPIKLRPNTVLLKKRYIHYQIPLLSAQASSLHWVMGIQGWITKHTMALKVSWFLVLNRLKSAKKSHVVSSLSSEMSVMEPCSAVTNAWNPSQRDLIIAWAKKALEARWLSHWVTVTMARRDKKK